MGQRVTTRPPSAEELLVQFKVVYPLEQLLRTAVRGAATTSYPGSMPTTACVSYAGLPASARGGYDLMSRSNVHPSIRS